MNMNSPQEYLMDTARESQEIREDFLKENSKALIQAAQWLGETVRTGGKVLVCGNGGSAADAQHIAAEMVGRMLIERGPVAAIALSTDTSTLTAVANDYAYDEVFARQVEALGRKGDLLIAISTSGNSKNVLKAVESAKKLGIRVLGLTGGNGGKLLSQADLVLNARLGKNASRIQETHIFAYHSLIDLMDRFFLKK